MDVGHEVPPSKQPPEQTWPAVHLAYEYARPSYDLMLKRFEVLEGRIRSLITLAASLTFGAPVFLTAVRGAPLPYGSPWFAAAMACAAVVLVTGTLAFSHAKVRTYDLDKIQEAGVRFSEWEFQRVILKSAADTMRINDRRLEWRGRAADLMAWALLGEFALMAIWAVTSA